MSLKLESESAGSGVGPAAAASYARRAYVSQTEQG